jgi:cytochrome c2
MEKMETIMRYRRIFLAGVSLFAIGGAGSFVAASAQDDASVATNSIQTNEVAKALADMSLVDAGKSSFVKCQACHMVGENAQRRVGPPLNGIVGRAAGTSEGFPYSPGMKKAAGEGLVWSVEKLDAFLTSPREVVPGTIMGFAGIPKPEERQALIAYLASYTADGSRLSGAPE